VVGYAPDPISEKKKRKKEKDRQISLSFLSFFLSFCLPFPVSIASTLELSAALTALSR
jgi:hypothetical protein